MMKNESCAARVCRRPAAFLATAAFAGLFALSMAPSIAPAAVTVVGVSSTASQSVYDAAMLTTDLGNSATMSGNTPSLGSLAGLRDGLGSPTNLSTAGTLTNDAYYDGSAGFGTKNLLASNPTATFTFNTGAGGSSTGYSITSINSIYGWHDHASMSDQAYTVEYSTVAAPATFISLTTVAYTPFNPSSDLSPGGSQYSSSQVTITDTTGTLADGVAAIRFTFLPYYNASNVEQAGQLVREIDIIGVPTVPEPATAVLTLGAAVGLLRRRAAGR